MDLKVKKVFKTVTQSLMHQVFLLLLSITNTVLLLLFLLLFVVIIIIYYITITSYFKRQI